MKIIIVGLQSENYLKTPESIKRRFQDTQKGWSILGGLRKFRGEKEVSETTKIIM